VSALQARQNRKELNWVRWILDAGKDIAVDVDQLNARTAFINRVTKADVSIWQPILIDGKVDNRFLCCASNDLVDGVFITAHISSFDFLLSLRQVCESRMVVANTCIWERLAHKGLLYRLRRNNPDAELYFAKQELSVDAMRNFRQTTTILNVGQFGFQTSLSERELFKARQAGVEEALKQSFERISPIILIGEI
jgi:hypothetical protein